ncbi:MAG: TetR/AcrR family transcriptional regulator [Thermoleophilia bacterium]|nr:TetR/AcrR family transcriptional regulator [Thermoleophilia bacterium]
MSTSLSRTARRTTVAARVMAATMRVLLRDGVRRLRTAEIAREAGTTESTLFRHFGSLDEILSRTYDHAWTLVNEHVAAAAFTRPLPPDPVQALLADTAALWGMRDEDEAADAALVALLFMRRRREIIPDEGDAPAQRLFEARLDRIAASVVAAATRLEEHPYTGDPEHGALLLRTLVLNYAATVWLTWFTMPAGSDDITEPDHDLSADEAQMGVLTLIERALGVPVGALSQTA